MSKCRLLQNGILLAAEVWGERGVRRTMEDAHVIVPSLAAETGTQDKTFDVALYAILDGHGGKESSRFIASVFPTELMRQLTTLGQSKLSTWETDDRFWREVFQATFQSFDQKIATELANCKDGCTVVATVVTSSGWVYTATLGDSLAFFVQQRDDFLHAVPLGEAHKPWNIEEKERILRSGGTVENGRVNGVLGVSRSLGDISLKRFGMLCIPELTKFELNPQDNRLSFLLLGCDGLFVNFSACEIASKVKTLMQAQYREKLLAGQKTDTYDVKSLCKSLVEEILISRNSQDNVSVLLVLLSTGTQA
eukprot:GHVP01038112.1.p1 GENE.GHVP01038112.1~~GHVP01038112.1.p1  ORF type:complete len:316 (+),score=57.54 GHVP01038112.1:26-949(+)